MRTNLNYFLWITGSEIEQRFNQPGAFSRGLKAGWNAASASCIACVSRARASMDITEFFTTAVQKGEGTDPAGKEVHLPTEKTPKVPFAGMLPCIQRCVVKLFFAAMAVLFPSDLFILSHSRLLSPRRRRSLNLEPGQQCSKLGCQSRRWMSAPTIPVSSKIGSSEIAAGSWRKISLNKWRWMESNRNPQSPLPSSSPLSSSSLPLCLHGWTSLQ